ncbi:MAG: NADH-quinone oxidoreductase subunit L [Fimbriimonadaceae bacterium]|nr:NADH-quinone oxidoreductase subunit L [Fimbriimonadaceae bacterium]
MGGTNIELIGWVPALPLIGFLVQALLGKRIVDFFGERFGKKLMGTLAVLPVFAAFVLAAGIGMTLSEMGPLANNQVVTYFDWIRISGLHVPYEIVVDPLSITMALVVTGVGALIHLYATGYMAEERDYTRFFTYMNLFIGAMLILVLGNNLALMFIGWEGVGLCSYLLIGFWYKDLANAKAANKAFIVNRIGDWGFMLGMFTIVAFIATNAERISPRTDRLLSFDAILPALTTLLHDHPAIATVIGLLLFVGAMGKSAQFPLYLWLPDAMAGPTPVSALIHAATMVTAGVVMVNRMHVVFEFSPVASGWVAIVGCVTAIFAALVAFGQTDIKKVLAYSTVSQLGYMFVACGVGAYWAGMFHVVTHAFFKALLFLGSGAVIHAMAHEQDMRWYGNLRKYVPITWLTMTIGWLAIIGFPYLFAGFYSKEAIIGGALGNHHAELFGAPVGVYTGWLLLFGALLTSAYMTRLTFLTFNSGAERWMNPATYEEAGTDHHPHDDHAHAHRHHAHHGEDAHGFFYTEEEMARREALAPHDHHHGLTVEHRPREVSPSMWVPLAVLAALSTGVTGYLMHHGETFKHWLYPPTTYNETGLSMIRNEPVVHAEALTGHPHGWVGSALVFLSVGAMLIGAIYGYLVYFRRLPAREGFDLKRWSGFRRAAREQFYYDGFMLKFFVTQGGAAVGNVLAGMDKYVVDGVVNACGWLASGLGGFFRQFQTGYVRAYALVMLIGGVALLVYFATVGQGVAR